MGKKAIAIYSQHVSGKVRDRLRNLYLKEKRQELTQAESYKSTISHELRTPMQSIGVIAKMILDQIKGKKLSAGALKEIRKQLSIILSQTSLMESFVEDLLNLKLIKEGILNIQVAEFRIYDAFDFIIDVFKPKAEQQGIKVFWGVKP